MAQRASWRSRHETALLAKMLTVTREEKTVNSQTNQPVTTNTNNNRMKRNNRTCVDDPGKYTSFVTDLLLPRTQSPSRMRRRFGATAAALLMITLTVPMTVHAQTSKHSEDHRRGEIQIPEAMRLEHAEIHNRLVSAT